MVFKITGIVMVLALAGLFIGCSEESTPADSATGDESAHPATAAVEEVSADYPIDYCIVSGEKLGSMGDAVEVEVEGRTVKLCCAMCKDDLLSDPATYLAKLDAAAAGHAEMPETDTQHSEHQH